MRVCICSRDSQIDRQELRVRQQADRYAEPWTGATSHTDQHVLEHGCIMCVPIVLLCYSCVTGCIRLNTGGAGEGEVELGVRLWLFVS